MIKSAGAREDGVVRSHRSPAPVPVAPPVANESNGLRARIAELEGELWRSGEAARGHGEKLAAQFERGRLEGHRQGLLEAARLEQERLAVLSRSVEEAAETFRDRMAATETLAILIARACLEAMLGSPDGRADLVCKLVREQLARLAGDTRVVVRVSPEDFTSSEALADLGRITGSVGAFVETDPDLRSGDVTMSLGLGEIELGVGRQWGSLRDLLDHWVLAGAGA